MHPHQQTTTNSVAYQHANSNFDILEINPSLIPQHTQLISRYQQLIRHYDGLTSGRKKIVQIELNVITKQLTQLLNQTLLNFDQQYVASANSAGAQKLHHSIQRLELTLKQQYH